MSVTDPLRCIEASVGRHRPITRIWVAFSGGLDSHVLLHRLTSPNGPFKAAVNAVHVDHGLQPAAADWVSHCEMVCEQLRVPIQVERVVVSPGLDGSPEEAARRARYSALARLLKNGEVVVTAHHLDDQAETLLLQLARGAGIPGLAAMPECAHLGEGRLLRPMLELRGEQLLDYARQHDLHWVEDPSNRELRFERNFIRHRIMPALIGRWPAFSGNTARSARHCGEAKVLLEELGALDIERVQGPSPHSLRLGPLLELSGPRQRNLVRQWIARLNLPIPASRHLDELFRSLVPARSDRQPRLAWPGTEIRRYRGMIYAMAPLCQVPSQWRLPLVLGARIEVPGGGIVELERDPQGSISCERLSGKKLELGFRTPGARLRLSPGAVRRPLKSLFQEAGVLPWARDRTPVLFADGEIVALAGLWTNADFRVSGDRAGAMFRWQKEPPFDRLATPYGKDF